MLSFTDIGNHAPRALKNQGNRPARYEDAAYHSKRRQKGDKPVCTSFIGASAAPSHALPLQSRRELQRGAKTGAIHSECWLSWLRYEKQQSHPRDENDGRNPEVVIRYDQPR